MKWDDCPDAVTDRGWLHLAHKEHPDFKSGNWYYSQWDMCAPTACGNYLFYPRHGKYHIDAYIIRVTKAGTMSQKLDIPERWFNTRDEAKAAIEKAIKEQLHAMSSGLSVVCPPVLALA